ncbi:trypsin-7-like [Bacillus rossius redtenbacheri]|uniref:trypsin-7-like n=1 Tax=Bacillus rossius redtenbacheri TaxID=93214 RepID=UPI002FDEA70C
MMGIIKIVLLASACLAVAAASRVLGRRPGGISRIAGGSVANIEDYPYTVAVHYDGMFMCGGAIISEKWFLTAARCIGEQLKERFTAYVGSSKKYANGTDHPVSQIIFHPKYHMYGQYQNYPVYDLAVVRVKKSFVFSEKIQPVKLPTPNQVFSIGSLANLTGWGDVNATMTEVYVMDLRAVSLPLMSRAACEAVYGEGTVTRSMLCAGYEDGGKTACDDDIGGPLVADDVLVGILSWGVGCGGKYPDVFTDLTFLRDWILTRTGV